MGLLVNLMAFLSEGAAVPLPFGKIEYVSLAAFQAVVIWVLWKQYQAKDKLLDELMREQMRFLERNESVLKRFEEFLTSWKAPRT
jgi:hypothetical protein